MDAQLKHLLKLINGDIDQPGPAGDSERRLPSDTDAELLDAYSRAVVAVVDAVGPAVVSISGHNNRRRPRATDQTGAGSGVVIAPDGYILTNDHVIQNANTLKVRLTDGTSLSAAVIGKDPATDLAVIRANASYLPSSNLGNSDRSWPWAILLGFNRPSPPEWSVPSGEP